MASAETLSSKKDYLKRKFASKVAITAAALMVISGGIDACLQVNETEAKLAEAYPSGPSSSEVIDAQKEVTLFDNKMHSAILAGKPIPDVIEQTDMQEVRESLQVIAQDEEIYAFKSRNGGRVFLDAFVVAGGAAVVLLTIMAPTPNPRGQKRQS